MKKQKVIRTRHAILYALIRPLVILYLWCTFGYRYRRARNLPENYIVLSNHATDYDVILVASAFRKQMYFVASEHIARWGWLYRVLDFVFAPIVRYKGASAGAVVMEVLRRTRKGKNVCIFAEGVRTWDGVTCPILPSTAQLCKAAGCGLVTFRITGGYFASPMWSGASKRRGELRGGVVRTFTKEEVAQMSEEELYRIICEDLSEDAYARQLASPKKYRGRRRAEHLESLMFLCPECNGNDTFSSKGDTVTCRACGHRLRYDEYGMLHGGKFRTLREFSDWQNTKVQEDAERGVTYRARNAELITVEKHKETHVTRGPVSLSAEQLTVGDVSFRLSEISDLAMHGQHAIVFTAGKTYYELLPNREENALRFFLLYRAIKSLKSENRTPKL